MKVKLLKKLRREADKRYVIAIKGNTYRIYNRAIRTAYEPNARLMFSDNLDLWNDALKQFKEAYILNRLHRLKMERALRRYGYNKVYKVD